MSDLYLGKDGYKPLLLPSTGEELLEGRQYALTPLARLVLFEVYGLRGVPTIVECIKRRVAATRLETKNTNLETGEVRESITELPAQQATFKYGRHQLFELDLAKLEEHAPNYDRSHKLPAFEEDWFETRCLPALNRKFRGCSLRWWEASREGVATRISSSRRSVIKLDLSILD